MALSFATAAMVAACGPSRAPRTGVTVYSQRQLQSLAGACETACGFRRATALEARGGDTLMLRFTDPRGVSFTQFQCLMEMLRPATERGVRVVVIGEEAP